MRDHAGRDGVAKEDPLISRVGCGWCWRLTIDKRRKRREVRDTCPGLSKVRLLFTPTLTGVAKFCAGVCQ